MGMKKLQGYTLIELMVVVAVMAILLTVGLPQLNTFFGSNRMIANTNDFVSAIQIARSEAIKRGGRVSMCKSSNADAGTPSCATGSNWEDGWIVFVDSDSTTGQYNSASDGVLLRRHTSAAGAGVTITTSDNIIQNYISFTSRGVPKTANGGAQSGMYRICDGQRRESTNSGLTNQAGAVLARGVILSASGKVRLSKDAAVIGMCP